MIKGNYLEQIDSIQNLIKKLQDKKNRIQLSARRNRDCPHDRTIPVRGLFVGYGPGNHKYYENWNECVVCQEKLDKLTTADVD